MNCSLLSHYFNLIEHMEDVPMFTGRINPVMPVILLISLVAFLLSSCSIRHPDADGSLTFKIDDTLSEFKKSVKGGRAFLDQSKGVLVFPSVVKAGLAIGGEYGEGALLIDNVIVDYYSITGASLGFQIGAQRQSLVLTFMTEKSLLDFQRGNGWEAGIDGSVAVVEWGVGADVTTTNYNSPVVGFIFDNEGLMYNITLEGAKFTKLPK